MNLVQFNVDVKPELKKRVKRDSLAFELKHDVIANTVFEDFFKRYPKGEDRRRMYEEMKSKLNGATGGTGTRRLHLEALAQ